MYDTVALKTGELAVLSNGVDRECEHYYRTILVIMLAWMFTTAQDIPGVTN